MKEENKKSVENEKLRQASLVTKVESVYADNHGFAYADNVNVGLTPFDIKLTFGIVQGVTPDRVRRVLNHTTIAMSPQQAKVLASLLVEAVKRYEKDVMPLPIKSSINFDIED